MTLTDEQLLEAMQELARRGIGLYVQFPVSGFTHLDSDVAIRYMSFGEDEMEAAIQGVTVSKYRAWWDEVGYEIAHGGCYFVQCSGTTKKGRRCKNMVERDWISPKEYDPDEICYCRQHEPLPPVAEDAIDIRERMEWEK